MLKYLNAPALLRRDTVKPRNKIGLASITLLYLLLSSATQAAPENNTAQLDIYTHPGVATGALSRSSLRAIFAMRLSLWPDGKRIQVFVLPDKSPLHRQFSKSMLGLFPYQLRKTWDKGVYSGTGEAPIQVADPAEMLDKIARTPGAIGYLLQGQYYEGVSRVAAQ